MSFYNQDTYSYEIIGHIQDAIEHVFARQKNIRVYSRLTDTVDCIKHFSGRAYLSFPC